MTITLKKSNLRSHSKKSPCSEDSGLDDSSYRSTYDDPETPIEKEIRIAMEREENFRREKGFSKMGKSTDCQWLEMEEQTKNQIVSPATKQPRFHSSHSFMYTPVRNIERPHKREHDLENLNLKGFSKMGKSTDCAPSRSVPRSTSAPLTPSFIITSSPSKGPLKHEVSANNVIILEPSNDFPSSQRHDTDTVAAQSSECASEFSLNKVCEQPQEKMFLNNPFFKLRSRSQMSLVDEEIKMVKRREEELRQERARMYGKDRFSTGLMICLSQFPEVYSGGRRKSAMALRWEAGEFAKKRLKRNKATACSERRQWSMFYPFI
uniref:Uncharacterized protein n=1 Tax=Myripristis murdjan TaxID=586833 RepID=A0A667X5Y7_9TELE